MAGEYADLVDSLRSAGYSLDSQIPDIAIERALDPVEPRRSRLSLDRRGQLGGLLSLDTPTVVMTPVVDETTFLTEADQVYQIEVPQSAGRLQVIL